MDGVQMSKLDNLRLGLLGIISIGMAFVGIDFMRKDLSTLGIPYFLGALISVGIMQLIEIKKTLEDRG